MTKRDDDDSDYEVGYGRPPKNKQFKKGESGNPRGRPKGAKGFIASLERELAAKITVREGDKETEISKAEALAKRLTEKALKGDIGAIKMLAAVDADLSRKVEANIAADATYRESETDDLKILRHFTELVRSGEWEPDKGSDEE